MAKTPLEKRLERLAGKKKLEQAKLDVDIKTRPSKKVKVKKVTKGAVPTQKAKDFIAFVNRQYSQVIRKKMDKDPHVVVIDVNQFKSLVIDHQKEVRRIIPKVTNPELKKQLEAVGNQDITKLATKLYEEFIPIFEKHLDKQIKAGNLKYGNKTKRPIVKSKTTLYIFVQGDKETSQTKTIFSRIQEVFTEIRKDLVLNSRAGSEQRVLSVIIAGFDIEFDDVSKGVGGDKAKRVYTADPIIGPSGVIGKGRGIQLGHFRGPNTRAASNLRNKVAQYADNNVEIDHILARSMMDHDLIHKHDAEYELNDVVYDIAKAELSGTVNISIIGLEQTARNSISGGAAGKLLNELRKFLIQNAEAIVALEASKSIANSILDDLVDGFLGYNVPSRRIKKKLNDSRKTRVRTGSIGPEFGTRVNSSKLGLIANDEEGLSPESLQQIIDLVNRRLHDKIRENMGKGGSRTILNYRTGRFARSAEVQAFYDAKERNAIGARVKYMKDPYQVFEPGASHLALPGRNPAKIFGRSIRQILQEEKIANLRRVKVDLSG